MGKEIFPFSVTFPIILEQLTKQKLYWQELYDLEYYNRRNIEDAIRKKEKIKQEKHILINKEYEKIILSIKEIIYNVIDDEIREYFLTK